MYFLMSGLSSWFLPSCTLGPGSASDGTSEWRSADHIHWSANHGTGCAWRSRSDDHASPSFGITRITAGQYTWSPLPMVMLAKLAVLTKCHRKAYHQILPSPVFLSPCDHLITWCIISLRFCLISVANKEWKFCSWRACLILFENHLVLLVVLMLLLVLLAINSIRQLCIEVVPK